jgi:PAS domain S-box-containing protein
VTWSYSYSPDVWPAILTLAVAIYLGLYSWRRRHIPGARWFVAASVLSVFWILGTILEISAVDLPAQWFWRRYQTLWGPAVSVAVTCFILQFAGLGRWLRLSTYIILFLVPGLHVLAIVTSFFLSSGTGFESRGHAGPLPAGPFWFFTGYVYLVGVVNLSVLVWLAVRSPRHRWPVVIIMGGQMLGRVGYTLFGMDLPWFGPGEAILLTLGVVAVAYATAFFGFHLIDPVTAARTSVLQQMREGMFVLDLEGRILDVNPMAASIAEVVEAKLRGRPISEVLPLDVDLVRGAADTGPGQTELVLGKPGRDRYYVANVTPLRGREDELIGRLLLLHDVTEEKQAQARILDQQEVVATLRERERLARELHDGIGQVLGYLGMQAETARQWLRKGASEKAEPVLGRLTEVARDAHCDVRESILNLKGDSVQDWAFLKNLERYLEKYQANYSIRTEISIADGVGEGTVGPAAGVQLLRVVQEALSNARKHGHASNVRVTVDTDGSRARITIADDGHGFDKSQLEGEGGNHYGLVFMRERMQQISGSMEIDSKPGGGTTLRLDVPTRNAEGERRESTAG